jgi:coproporphyrinogen III oxidase
MSIRKTKNLKISDRHHDKLKSYCDEHGMKIYKVVEMWVDKYCTDRKKDLYGE